MKKPDDAALRKKLKHRLEVIFQERGINANDLVRHSKKLKFATINRWLYGTRFPEAQSIVDLAAAITEHARVTGFGTAMTVEQLLEGVGAPLKTRLALQAITSP